MICDRVLGNLEAGSFTPAEGAELDEVEVTWQECSRRFLRKITRAGRKVGVLLPAGCFLRHGDVLHATPTVVIAASVPSAEVLVVRAETAVALGTLAYTIGTLHCPAEMIDGGVVVPADDAVEATLARLGFSPAREVRRFQPLPLAPAAEWQTPISSPPE